ncbi:hypothetical protein Asera_64350 [Actinocatenispora sera]|uniref:Uncharacterized protein n=1 Tax=Actinocatenispora sera TaxID=390989 RepID=A0A810LAP0_9ACTN|nr:hypothetical protein Asera_64350 [Actinocatenispora sera]
MPWRISGGSDLTPLQRGQKIPPESSPAWVILLGTLVRGVRDCSRPIRRGDVAIANAVGVNLGLAGLDGAVSAGEPQGEWALSATTDAPPHIARSAALQVRAGW